MYKDFSFQRDNKIILKEKGRSTLIQTDQITHITCKGSLAKVHTTRNKNFAITKLLKQFESELMIFGFLRANYNTIVNMIHVREIQGSPNRKMILANDIEIKISRRRMHLFREFFEKTEAF